MRSKAGYFVGGGLIVAAIGGAIMWGVLSFVAIANTLDDFARVDAGESKRVQLEARKYIVYAEGAGAGGDFRPAVQFAVLAENGDTPLALESYGGSLTYSIGAHEGTAVATVRPPRAGTYTLRVAGDATASGGYGVALGESIGGRIVRAIGGALALGALLGFAGIGLIIATWVRRRRPPDIAGIAP
jgi:hypothetical protein